MKGRNTLIVEVKFYRESAKAYVGRGYSYETDMALNTLGDYARDLYVNAKPCNGTRWLMFRVADETALRDALTLIGIRYRNRKR